MTTNIRTCKKCQKSFDTLGALRLHYNQNPQCAPNKTAVTRPVSAIDRIAAATEEIKQALLQIDEERRQCQERLLRLDELHAKYKKLC